MPIDYKRYPPNWKSEIVPAVLTRANNCCEECGVHNASIQWRGIKTIDKIINGKKRRVSRTFHYDSKESAIKDGCFYDECEYLNHPECKFTSEEKEKRLKEANPYVYQVKIVLTIAHLDHDETNWDVQLDRLKAMCQLCHLQYDAAEKYRRSLVKQS